MKSYNIPIPESAPLNGPACTITCVSNIFIKQLFYKNTGDRNDPHKHLHDHVTLLGAGAVDVRIDGEVTHFKAPAIIFVSADQLHYFTATEDNTVCYCIHGIRSTDGSGDILDPSMIPAGTRTMTGTGIGPNGRVIAESIIGSR
jgi:hypothetical protein